MTTFANAASAADLKFLHQVQRSDSRTSKTGH